MKTHDCDLLVSPYLSLPSYDLSKFGRSLEIPTDPKEFEGLAAEAEDNLSIIGVFFEDGPYELVCNSAALLDNSSIYFVHLATTI
ncbi:MAG: putative amidohydrolase [Motiliproteus sp.]